MSLDQAMGRAARWASAGVVIGATLFLVERPTDLLSASLTQLSAIVAFGFLLTMALAPVADQIASHRSPSPGAWFSRAASVIAIITGTVLIVTLVSSVSLGLEVSLQFLQVLSALDIAWVVAGVYLGLRWRLGLGAATAGGVLIGIVCVWSNWRYLDAVGFTPDGGWLVDVDALNRLVFPMDIMAAVLAISALWWGARYATVQRNPQS